jgi:hypothetical protein
MESPGRLPRDHHGRRNRVSTETSWSERDNLITNGESVYTCTERYDCSGALPSQRNRTDWKIGVKAQALQHVIEIKRRGSDLNLHFAGPRRPPSHGLQTQIIQNPWMATFQTERLVARRNGHGCLILRRPRHARDVAFAAAQDHFGLDLCP